MVIERRPILLKLEDAGRNTELVEGSDAVRKSRRGQSSIQRESTQEQVGDWIQVKQRNETMKPVATAQLLSGRD